MTYCFVKKKTIFFLVFSLEKQGVGLYGNFEWGQVKGPNPSEEEEEEEEEGDYQVDSVTCDRDKVVNAI
jgi:hypothetical protein